MTDFGLEALAAIHGRLMIDEHWTVREPRAFSWVAHRLSQRVDASPMFESLDMMITRITSSVVLVEDIDSSREVVEGMLGWFNHLAVGSAYLYDPLERSIAAMLAHNVHAGTMPFRPEDIASYQIIALILAERHADTLADRLRGRVAHRQHPVAGERLERDDMLNVLSELYQPRGREPNRFSSDDEMRQVHELVQETYDFSAGGNARGIAIEVAFGENETTLIQLMTDHPHPDLGQGLGVFLTLPARLPETDAARIANQLNLRQFEERETIPAFGSWCVRHIGEDSHVGRAFFVPNANFRPGRAVDCAMSAINQAVWVDNLFHPHLSRRSALPAVAKRHGRSGRGSMQH